MLRRAGYDDVTVFERGERVGGVWHHNTYPGAACDVPSHLYEFSFAPNPRWSRRYAPQAEIQAYVEDVARAPRRARPHPHRHRGQRARAGTTSARKWVLETSAGAHEADVLLTACGQLSVPPVPPIPGLDELRGPGVPHRALAPRRRPRRQARRGGRHRLQRDPGRARDPADRRARRRLPALARLDDPEDGLRLLASARSACSSASRCSSASTARAIFAFMEFGAAGDDQPAAGCCRPFRAVARRQITKAIDDPELRRKVTPTDEIGCKRIMLTDDWYPTLTKPNVELVTDRDRRGHADRHPHRGRHRAPGRRARARHRLQDARRSSRRWRSPAPAAARSPRSGRRCRAPTSG